MDRAKYAGPASTSCDARHSSSGVCVSDTGDFPAELKKPSVESAGLITPEGTLEAIPSTPGKKLPRILAVANQKGGVGKTTTTVNLGAALADMGLRTLLIDLDPQGNASTGLGIENRGLELSMYHVLMHEESLDNVV